MKRKRWKKINKKTRGRSKTRAIICKGGGRRRRREEKEVEKINILKQKRRKIKNGNRTEQEHKIEEGKV